MTDTPADPLDDPDWLRARHHDDGWSAERIAAETSTTSTTVAARLAAHGIPLRTAPDRPRASREWLEQRYLIDRDGTQIIAEELGCAPMLVWKALVDYGIPRRPAGGLLADDPTATINDPDWLRARHHDDRWSVTRIADHLGISRDTVTRRLDDLGIHRYSNRQLRIRDARDRLEDADWLRTRHHDRGDSVHRLADELGLPAIEVAHAMGRHDIDLRVDAKQVLSDRHQMHDLHIDQRLSRAEIARRLGVHPRTVTRHLRRHDIT